jgi:methylthioribose-1-phosphate isomerase
MPVKTISWEDEHLIILDQTLLPVEERYIELRDVDDVFRAIKRLEVRGAPAIGVAAALGLYVSLKNHPAIDSVKDYAALRRLFDSVKERLAASRPTAVNLFWALERMERVITNGGGDSPDKLLKTLRAEALAMLEEDRVVCRAIGKHGQELLADGDSVLTHCNAGGLATVDYGTALAVIYAAVDAGKRISVYADETRPLLQGARLTAWELHRSGVPVTVITDSMAAVVMREGRVSCVITGADRVAANGDAANKIGTYGLAILAREHKLPFYVAAPLSTFDLSLPNGDGIPIEERNGDEVRNFRGVQTVPAGVAVYNPAFDVTPARLITAFITEEGIVHPPFTSSLTTEP